MNMVKSNNMEKNVMIINHYDALASIGIYSKSLNEALGNRSELFSLSPRFLSKDLSLRKYPGNQIKGLFPDGIGLHFLNQILPNVSYFKTSRRIKEIKRNSGFIHYSSSLMLPLDSSIDNVVSIHDIIFLKDTGIDAPLSQRKYFELAFRRFARYKWIITPTDFVKQELMDYGVDGQISVIPYCTADYFKPITDKISLRKKLNLPLDKILVLSVSTDVARKNLRTVKNVMDSLGPQFKLVRVGSQVGESITFNQAFGEMLNEIYNACDLLLFPTLDEGLGYPMIEAFAVGLPVVASDIPVCNEVCGNAASYAEPFDTQQMVTAIKDVLNNHQEFSNLSRDRSTLYSKSRFKMDIDTFYSSL